MPHYLASAAATVIFLAIVAIASRQFGGIAFLAPWIVGAGLVAWWARRRNASPALLSAMGAAIGLGALVLPLVWGLLAATSAVWPLPRRFFVELGIVSALVALGGGVLLCGTNLVLSVLARANGSHCTVCGYCILHLSSDRCPECGNSIGPPREVLVVQQQRHRFAALVVVLSLFAGLIAVAHFRFGGRWWTLTSGHYWRYLVKDRERKRGVAFYELLVEVEQRAATVRVTQATIRDILGDPDYVCVLGTQTDLVYAVGGGDYWAHLETESGILKAVMFYVERGATDGCAATKNGT